MTIVVTGATGQLGRLVVQHLLTKVPADQVIGSVRNPDKGADLGIELRHGDFDRPETLAAAFAGADKLLIISTDGEGAAERVRQHTNAVQAAKAAGVQHILYTSLTSADTATIVLADTHRPTEEVIKASGIPYTILRNNWYFENDLGTIAGALATGALATSSRSGRFAPAARADFAAAAAAALTTEGHQNTIYELGGPVSYSYADFAKLISEAAGKDVEYVEISPAEAKAGLLAAGLPEGLAGLIVDSYRAIGEGELDVPRGDLEKLIGRPALPLREFIAQAVRG
ncbi:SDR family oxidoreductase [Crossiella cryophila]|uniref:NAD(P)H dehydrogenase (Quinone) n=1 Tax=Crossiella cryophila TaxID=43355 RepID=A0A7W7CGQ7_9PSEU|nr:SDR family oxidoreductase [Crossiella cryophila]MBB4680935.1 NAD(P)H dehydrogenase (quinone) [Crossiella cryophila]